MKCANFECNPMQGWSLCGWMGRDIFDAKFQKKEKPSGVEMQHGGPVCLTH